MPKNNFDVKIVVEHGFSHLHITHNGYHWSSISIENPRHEIPLIIEALADCLYEHSLFAQEAELKK